MILSRLKVNLFLYFWIICLTFLGYYAILVFIFNIGLDHVTRTITVPLRLVITSLLFSLFLMNLRKINGIRELKVFSVFAFAVLFRILIDINQNEPFYLTYPELLFFFLSFSVIPFVVIAGVPFKEVLLNTIIHAFVISGLIFSFVVVWFYARFIGQVSRLSSGIVEENVISPLILSYSSSLVIGVLVFYFLNNRTSYVLKLLGFSAIILSFVPFFLGASRGSLIALFLPFILLIFYSRKKYFKNFILVGCALGLLIILDSFFESGLLDRFSGISSSIEKGSDSAIRLEIWKSSFKQFLNNPILGDRMEMNYAPGYAHNFFIEVLQTVGLLGFLPFSYLVFRAWRISLLLLKSHKKYSWVSVVFIQSFFQGMFSGTIFSAVWFWVAMAILFALYEYLRKDKFHKYNHELI